MRIYVAVIVGLLLAVSVGVITMDRLDATTNEIVAGFDELERAVDYGKWEEAGGGIGNVEKLWKKHNSWWAIVIDHQEIDNINMALARTKQYIKMQDRAMASGELAVLKQMLEHIPEKEKVNLKNIL